MRSARTYTECHPRIGQWHIALYIRPTYASRRGYELFIGCFKPIQEGQQGMQMRRGVDYKGFFHAWTFEVIPVRLGFQFNLTNPLRKWLGYRLCECGHNERRHTVPHTPLTGNEELTPCWDCTCVKFKQ